MSFTVLIPARMASTRLPGKPLANIAGIPMIVRVAQRVAQLKTSSPRIVVATDSHEVALACQRHGVQAVMTDAHHPSGSDRLAQACTLLNLPDDEVVVNVQGDEPLIDPALVQAVADLLNNSSPAPMGTAAHAIDNVAEFLNPNVVKVVLDAASNALYFSRAPISFPRDNPAVLPSPAPLRHVGIYSYRAGFLRQFPALPQSPCERTESLEQLRVLWHGHKIAVHVCQHAPGPGVDTPQDLERVRTLYAQGQA